MNQKNTVRHNIFNGSLSDTNFPFAIVAASDLSSCCLRSMYHADNTPSCHLDFWGLVRQRSARRQARETASRKPDAIPCPPTIIELSQFQTLRYIGVKVCIQGGKTWAASPHKITRPSDHLLQLRAEKLNGRHRRTWMQSSGKAMSFGNLGCLSKAFVSMMLARHELTHIAPRSG